ncbi:fibronectin type III domain-containing protein [Actinoplanes sp. NPDC026623]|uniref:fibronectin type III domain-containing protein n=1 Tax=Actinoplanes sp. NPDC026623 TaxID=3155610 RepID=UPI0033F934B0
MSRRNRLPLVLLGAICLVAGTAAVSGASPAAPLLRFASVGRWFADPSGDRVFHVNGMSRTIDARVQLDEVKPGTEVVEGERSSYVIGPDDIRELDKSSLAVTATRPAPSSERPVPVDAAGGPYAVYRGSGRVVRLGADEVVVEAGGPLGPPATTPDGTLWLHRIGTGLLCHLAPGTDRPTCPVQLSPGHAGALSVLGPNAVFLDFTDDTMTVLSPDGPGRVTALGPDLRPGALVAPAAVNGRIAVVAGGELLLLDAHGLAGQVTLPAGRWATPVAGRSSIVLLELSRRQIHTYTPDGRRQHVTRLPASTGDPQLRQGQDGRVYAQSGDGRHVVVVDDQGGAEEAGPSGAGAADGSAAATSAPVGATTTSPATAATHAGATSAAPGSDSDPATGATTAPVRMPTAPATPPPAEPQQPGPVRPGPPVETTTIPQGPTVPPAERPGTVPGLSSVARGVELILSWGAAPPNGAAITAYAVSWESAAGDRGSTEVGGDVHETALTGLARGIPYTIRVSARNENGTGDAAAIETSMPTRWVVVSRGEDTEWDNDCRPPECGYVQVELFGFPPNSEVGIEPMASDWGAFNIGARLGVNQDGHLLVRHHFPFNGVGQTVWIEIENDDVQSNRIVWPERKP